MFPPLNQQAVLVTGASSGIGEATVRRLAGAGARVAFTARRQDRLEVLAKELDPRGERMLALGGDVTREEDRRRWVETAVARFGRIDALVNNAGYGQRGAVEQVPLDAIRRNFETNVFGLLGLTQQVLPLMRAQGFGRIVNIGSVAGRIARPLSSVYDATKHALEAFDDGLRGELKPFGLEVVLVRPGFIASDFAGTADRVSAGEIAGAGPYAPFAQNFRGGARRLRWLAGSPDDVARVVERCLAARHPKTHYTAPAHAALFLLLKTLLPTRLLDRALRLRG